MYSVVLIWVLKGFADSSQTETVPGLTNKAFEAKRNLVIGQSVPPYMRGFGGLAIEKTSKTLGVQHDITKTMNLKQKEAHQFVTTNSVRRLSLSVSFLLSLLL